MKHLSIAGIVLGALLSATGRPAVGDVFVLTQGGQVVGECLNPDELPRTKFVIQTPAGGRITLGRSQVKRVVHAKVDELEYERIRPAYADTVEDQWALAEWCREHHLSPRRQTHLQRVLELDADHTRARHALGYNRQDGKWILPDEVMRQRGYVRWAGAWRLPQAIALSQRRQQTTKARGEWVQKVRIWHRWLDGEKDPQARGNLLAIKDPHAVKALATGLKDRRTHVRMLYIEALARIGTPEAAEVLRARSLEDPVEEVRLTCLDYLKTRPSAAVTAYYLGALGSKENAIVNRAAVALSQLKEPSAVGPLIGVLITTHKQKITQGSPGGLSPTFGVGPGGAPGPSGLGVGGSTKIITYHLRNQPVLDALVSLTGANFGFQQQAWKDWLASQSRVEAVNLRRD